MKTDLVNIPGIGAKMAQRLIELGYLDVASLKGKDPEDIYTEHRL